MGSRSRKDATRECISEADRNRLIEESLPDALFIARKRAGADHGLREDLEDEVLDGLVEAALRFDPCRGSFWYAQPTVLGRISMFFRKALRRGEVSAGFPVVAEDVDVVGESAARIDGAALIDKVHLVLAAFGLDGAVVMDALLGRCTQREAAAAMGMRYHKFWRRLKQAKAVMRDVLLAGGHFSESARRRRIAHGAGCTRVGRTGEARKRSRASSASARPASLSGSR